MKRKMVLVALGYLMLCATCFAEPDIPGTKASEERAQPYAIRWNEWVASSTPTAESYPKIASEYEALALIDHYAATLALIKVKIEPEKQRSIISLLKPNTRKALKLTTTYWLDHYYAKHNRGWTIKPYPPGLPPLGQGLPSVAATGSNGRTPSKVEKLLADADLAGQRLKASTASQNGNYKEAFRLYLPLAEAGDPGSQYSLAWMYLFGNGVESSEPKAFQWCQKSAKLGYAPAQCLLGQLWSAGIGTRKSEPQATVWYRAAAEQRHAEAQDRLGMRIWAGLGTAKSSEEAILWFRKSADQGWASGQFNLGLRYESGDGIAKSQPESIKWIRKSSEQNFAAAQFSLGLFYLNGNGVPVNRPLAIELFKKAAKQNYQLAKNILQELGVPAGE